MIIQGDCLEKNIHIEQIKHHLKILKELVPCEALVNIIYIRLEELGYRLKFRCKEMPFD